MAAIHFPNTADYLALCYDLNGIVNNKHLSAVRDAAVRDVSKILKIEIVSFRVVTVSIIFAVAGLLGGENFESLQYMTAIDMRFTSFSWIKYVLQLLDAGLIDRLSMGNIVDVFFAVYTSGLPSQGLGFSKNDLYKVGYRNGIYGVLPALLFEPQLDLNRTRQIANIIGLTDLSYRVKECDF